MRKPNHRDFFVFSLLFALTIISLCSARSAIGQVLLYEQPFVPYDNLVGFYSNRLGQVAADQFELSKNATITRVQWYGFYTVDLDPNIISRDFRINFFSDETGWPSSNPISQQIVSAKIQDTGFTAVLGLVGERKVYQFSTELTLSFPVTADETNWISISAIQPNWLWKYSPPNPGASKKAYRGEVGAPPYPWFSSYTNGQLAFSLWQGREPVLIDFIDFESFPGPDGILGTYDDGPAPDCPGSSSVNPCSRLSSEFETMGLYFNSGALFQGDIIPGSSTANHYVSSSPLDVGIPAGGDFVSVNSYSVWTAVLWLLDDQDKVINKSTLTNPMPGSFFSGTLTLTSTKPFARFTVRAEGCAPDAPSCDAILILDDLKVGFYETSPRYGVLNIPLKLQELYVGILGRAADRPGLDYWLNQIYAKIFTLENTRAAFTHPDQTEYTEIYGGLNNTQLVTAIYENFLERAPELAGLQYWVAELDNGRVNADQMINAIINAVQDPNATGAQSAKDFGCLKNKIEVAMYFTEETKEYFFDAAYREMARAVVTNVCEGPEALAQAKAMIDEYVGN